MAITSRFFISRPIFSSVISIIIIIAGVLASQILPVAQYPEIAPPTVTITANYPGASAETIAKTVAAPIEDQLNGVEGMVFFNSSAAADGSLSITVTFDTGTNADMAAVNVSNRVKAAEPRLPDEVRRNGVVVQKRSVDILMAIGIYSPDNTISRFQLSNYATINIIDEMKRINGVGDAGIFASQDYSMRVWLKPDRMAQLGVTTGDIAAAIQAQNAQYAVGKVGTEPAPPEQQLVYTVTARGRLSTPEEFGNIILRGSGPGGVLKLKDVARIELGPVGYDAFVNMDGKPAVGVRIMLQTGANALETANRVKAKIEELSKKFPKGVSYAIPFDTTRFINASIKEVSHTLAEAALLVVLVVYVFLQSWRATLIPMVAVPVSLIGTFAGLWLFGFSINTLTLFAMVLAIGIVVDDAIVVLENVERLMAERKLSPRAAAYEAMREVSTAVIAIVLVLCAVFIPVAFLGGIAGQLYKQFAVTVAVAVVISGIVALTLTPALCALLLKPSHQEAPLFRPFNRAFAAFTRSYLWAVNKTLHHRIIGGTVFALVIGLAVLFLLKVPGSFVPPEDQGVVFGSMRLPEAATLTRTANAGAIIRDKMLAQPEVDHVFLIGGFDFIGGSNKPNAASMFVNLKHWDERKTPAEELVKRFSGMGMALPDGMAMVFNPPSIRGLGSTSGFEFYLQSRVNDDPKRLFEVINNFMDSLRQKKELTGITSFFRPNTPQIQVDVDLAKVAALGVPVPEVYNALQATMGALYVNDFNKGGRPYRVQIQADAPYRAKPEDLGRVHVRSATTGAMIPISALARIRSVVGPEQIERFNGFLAAKVMGAGAPGVASGDAIRLVEEAAATLPDGYTLSWAGQAFQEKRTGSSSVKAFAFAVIMVFLILAAQFEKWSLPLAVIMAVPFALLGALIAVMIRGMPNDIYFQIGLVTLIGLASKNAILIVEFASQKYSEGMSMMDAALEAARLRFRPIIMTSLAFVLGVVPLAFSSGAGAGARRSMGTGVFGGMIAATFIATIFIPMFFTWLSGSKPAHPADPQEEGAE